jgi:hypothetical protein
MGIDRTNIKKKHQQQNLPDAMPETFLAFALFLEY